MKGIKKIDENLIAPNRSLLLIDYNSDPNKINRSVFDNSNWISGALKCNPSCNGLTFKKINDQNDYQFFDAVNTLMRGSINETLIAKHSIKNNEEYDHLDNACVTANKIRKDAVIEEKIKDNAVTTSKIKNGAVEENKLSDNSVSTNKIQEGAITCYKITTNGVPMRYDDGDLRIATENLQDQLITSYKIRDGAVTEYKIAMYNVTNSRLSTIDGYDFSAIPEISTSAAVRWFNIEPGTIFGKPTEFFVDGQTRVFNGQIMDRSIVNQNIDDNTINERCMMNGAVTNRVIGEHEVYGKAIAPQAIQSGHIENETITSAQIAEKGITTENYADYSITKIKLDNEIINVVDNAVIYDEEGNVTILKAATCNVAIGSEDVDGKSNGNGYLRVYGDIKADRVYNMSYSDLAEGYIPGEELEAGDIVELREDGKVYKAFNSDIPSVVVGVVSDEFATCYGATKEEIEAGEKVAVGLIGKVHVKVNGKVKIGEPIRIGSMPGVGALWSTSDIVIGKALETSEIDGVHKVLCLIKPF